MSVIYYSATTGGLYIDSVHGDAIPEDTVEITREDYVTLLDGQAQGKRIVSDAEGFPILQDTQQATLADVKLAMWESIKAERERRKSGGFPVQVDGIDKWFHSDFNSRIQQLGLISMGLNIPPGLQWKTLDGSYVTMSKNIAENLLSAVLTLDYQAHVVAETHRSAMLIDDDPANYDFSDGWPVTYSET